MQTTHNDYLNDQPLTEALSLGVSSIEVDVFLLDNSRVAVAVAQDAVVADVVAGALRALGCGARALAVLRGCAALVAWRGFDLGLNLEGSSMGEGDYLRAFGAELIPVSVQDRAFNGSITATISTSSLSEWSDPFAGFEGALVRFGAPDLHAEHWTIAGSHPTGLATTGPTAE
jgi:hypothetical protein